MGDARHVLLVQEVLVLLEPDRPTEHDLLPIDREPVVGVVEHHFDVRRHHREAGALVQQGLALLGAQVGEDVAEDEPDGGEEVALPRPVPPDDDIALRAQIDANRVLVALEVAHRHALDVHRGRRAACPALPPRLPGAPPRRSVRSAPPASQPRRSLAMEAAVAPSRSAWRGGPGAGRGKRRRGPGGPRPLSEACGGCSTCPRRPCRPATKANGALQRRQNTVPMAADSTLLAFAFRC